MMYAIVDNFAQLVVAPPEPVIAADHVGVRAPTTPGDLPAVVVSLRVGDQRMSGLGRVMRSGEVVTHTTNLVEVTATPDTLSADLGELRLSPLPLRRNPTSMDSAPCSRML